MRHLYGSIVKVIYLLVGLLVSYFLILLVHLPFQVFLGLIQAPIQGVPGATSPGLSSRGLKLTTELYLVPRLRMCGTILPQPNTST